MINQSVFNQLIECLNLRERKYTDSGFYYTGIVDSETVDWIEQIISLGVLSIDVEIDGASVEESRLRNQRYRGKDCSISFIPHELRALGFDIYLSWEEYFRNKRNAFVVPALFYILKSNDFNMDGRFSSRAGHLLQLSSFLKLLVDFSDYSEEVSPGVVGTFVFLHKKRLNINVSVCEDDISEVLDGISILLAKLEDESHSEQKKSILKEVLSGMVGAIDEGDRLRYLIENFGVFSQRFSENYELFVSEFSFDDVRLEYEEKKRDYMAKLNDIFSSSLTKMIGVPISLALISFKMSVIVGDVTFFTNIMLFFAVIIYAFMMITLIKNQKHTLTALKLEYTGQMNRLKFSFSEQYDLIEKIVDDLDNRGDFQRECLNWYYVAVAVLALCVSGLFLYNLPWKAIML